MPQEIFDVEARTTMWWWVPAVGLAFLVCLPAGLAVFAEVHFAEVRSAEAHPVETHVMPAPGIFLIAGRGLRDPNFAETVVVLTHYDEKEGAAGVVVNRRTEVSVAHALEGVEGLEGRADLLYVGGPVSRGSMTILLRAAEPPAGAEVLLPGVAVLRTPEELKEALAGEVAAGSLRIYSGYAGWAPGQLEAEIARGGWHLRPGEGRWIFDDTPTRVWKELIELVTLPWT